MCVCVCVRREEGRRRLTAEVVKEMQAGTHHGRVFVAQHFADLRKHKHVRKGKKEQGRETHTDTNLVNQRIERR